MANLASAVWIPAFAGMTGVESGNDGDSEREWWIDFPGSAGVLARNAALVRGDTLILAFSHEGRRDPLAAIRA